jgi:NTE family protein
MNDPAIQSAERVLVLQGGGALGSYQAGVFEALAQEGVEPHWVAGISIGAINAALIAGNAPENRVARLKEFWALASGGIQVDPFLGGDTGRAFVSQFNAGATALLGVSGFFTPRLVPPQLSPPGSSGALSYYDTAPLKGTLERLVDFDRINAGALRFSVGAVNIESGNFAYFDNRRDVIGPEHIMASGALPPGFPPVEIDGEFYWDGGLVSNTPLEYVLEEERRKDLLIFQVDLFPARGPMPKTLAEADERVKDIRYSSRTRLNTDQVMRIQKAKLLVRELLDQLPPELAKSDTARELAELARENALTVVQLIYRRKAYESSAKDYEFSRATMLAHWASGVQAVRRSMAEREAILASNQSNECKVFDLKAIDEDTAAPHGAPA